MKTPRGFVLIFVLLSLLMMTLMTTALYDQASALAASTRTMTASQIATAHAEEGLQQAVLLMRNNEALMASIAGTQCALTPADADCASLCGVNQCYSSPPNGKPLDNGRFGDGGTPLSTAEGGGLQYKYTIYLNPAFNRSVKNVTTYTVQSIGYAGFADSTTGLPGPNVVSAVVSAEVQLPAAGKVTCPNDNYQDCQKS